MIKIAENYQCDKNVGQWQILDQKVGQLESMLIIKQHGWLWPS